MNDFELFLVFLFIAATWFLRLLGNKNERILILRISFTQDLSSDPWDFFFLISSYALNKQISTEII